MPAGRATKSKVKNDTQSGTPLQKIAINDSAEVLKGCNLKTATTDSASDTKLIIAKTVIRMLIMTPFSTVTDILVELRYWKKLKAGTGLPILRLYPI